jgi:predicted nucleic acid-binding protein
VSEAWVVNASPLILFSRIARLDLIERLAPTILVPDAVIEEVRFGEHKAPSRAFLPRRLLADRTLDRQLELDNECVVGRLHFGGVG